MYYKGVGVENTDFPLINIYRVRYLNFFYSVSV